MMSSKIPQIYYLTEYTLGHIIKAWPRSRYRATSANAVSTLGFPAKGMMRNPKFAQSVNRLIGTLPARTAKRQSGDKKSTRLRANGAAGYQGLYPCLSTMTMIESSEKSTITNIVRKVLRCFVSPPFRRNGG
jgi:hypothetical protein